MYQVKLASDGSHTAPAFGSIPAMAQIPRPDSRQAIGSRLRLVRLAYGRLQGRSRDMTQAEFTQLCHVNRQAWNNAETGDARIGLDSALAVCRQTGVTLDYIYQGSTAAMPHALMTEIQAIIEAETATAKRA